MNRYRQRAMLNNREYTALVETGLYPEEPEVATDPPFENANGEIQNLLLENFRSVALISSVEGAVRANHYHKTDWHYTYVISGAVAYFWRPAKSGEKPRLRIFRAGKMFFTPPLVEHAMLFLSESEVMTFAKNIRDTSHHEEDVVRVPLIQKEEIVVMAPGSAAEKTSLTSRFKVTFPDVPGESEIV